jgi:putative transposase
MIMHPKGWHSRGYLPHFDSPETVQFVTFRLADSLPRVAVEALLLHDDGIQLIDERLDAGIGACWLGRSEIASLLQKALMHFDGDRYKLLAWCVMPNQVHVIVEMTGEMSLSDIVKSWKSFTARQANVLLGRSGAFWHPDYFDRFMRNEGHLARTIDYVESNPVKAGLAASANDWPWSSAPFRGASES